MLRIALQRIDMGYCTALCQGQGRVAQRRAQFKNVLSDSGCGQYAEQLPLGMRVSPATALVTMPLRCGMSGTP